MSLILKHYESYCRELVFANRLSGELPYQLFSLAAFQPMQRISELDFHQILIQTQRNLKTRSKWFLLQKLLQTGYLGNINLHGTFYQN